MIEHSLDTTDGILYLHPRAALEASDFSKLSQVVDPWILEHGSLRGLVIESSAFPGWDSFGAMAAHVRFVKDHHRSIRKIAIVTDSPIGSVAEHLASHFVSAEIKRFSSDSLPAATAWIGASA
jgi:SpoIIAA-like